MVFLGETRVYDKRRIISFFGIQILFYWFRGFENVQFQIFSSKFR